MAATELLGVLPYKCKRPYTDREYAAAARRALARKFDSSEFGGLRVYKCKMCMRWHVGNVRRRYNRGRR